MDENAPTPRFGKVRSVLFALTPLLALLLVAEAVLRLGSFPLEVQALRVETSDDFTVRMFESNLANEHFVADPVTFWKPKPGYPPFNAFGYRGDELKPEKGKGELRILAVGDSNTLGHATSWVNEIPNAARGRLRNRIRVVNAGVYGYTSYQGRHHLERFLDLRPDVVLIGFGGNEATLNASADKDYVPYAPHPFYASFGRRLAVVNLMEYLSVRLALLGHSRTPSSLVSRVSLADYEADLLAMIEAARWAGARPVLVTRPLAFDYHAPKSKSRLKPYYESTLALGERSGVPVIDLDIMADHSWVLFADHSHFNVEGHRILGGYVLAVLKRILAGKDVGEVPRFRPRNRDERATHVIGRVVRTWFALEENVAKLRQDPRIEKLTPVYESDFTEGTRGWRVTARKAKGFDPVPRDGALCFAGRAESVVTLAREGLGFAESWPHFVWIEARSRSDVSMQLFWSSGADFDQANAAVAAFFRRPDEPTLRFFSTLPSGTRNLRLDLMLRGKGEVCLEKVYLAELVVPGRPAS